MPKYLTAIIGILIIVFLSIFVYKLIFTQTIFDKQTEVTYTTSMIGVNYRTIVDYPNPANINITEDDDSWTITFEISK